MSSNNNINKSLDIKKVILKAVEPKLERDPSGQSDIRNSTLLNDVSLTTNFRNIFIILTDIEWIILYVMVEEFASTLNKPIDYDTFRNVSFILYDFFKFGLYRKDLIKLVKHLHLASNANFASGKSDEVYKGDRYIAEFYDWFNIDDEKFNKIVRSGLSSLLEHGLIQYDYNSRLQRYFPSFRKYRLTNDGIIIHKARLECIKADPEFMSYYRRCTCRWYYQDNTGKNTKNMNIYL